MEMGLGGLLDYVNQGGYVMWPLVAATFVLWYALGHRYAVLNRGNRRSARILVNRYKNGYERKPAGIIDTAALRAVNLAGKYKHDLRKILDDDFSDLNREVGRYQVLVKSIVLVAPLAGLLGTVTGMIETFDSLGAGELHSQSGGVAGGISEALLTTQMGLVVAVPGMIVGRILDKRQSRIELELDQIKDLVSTGMEAEKSGEEK